ncbi:MAG: sugar ABC transporter ATP-binding protein [Verrucomicrobia bacterium]|nr:sugar ABC transporter ATP-binding protein [Verrucomicrobiota bacterium]
MLNAKGVSKSFFGNKVLDSVNFDVRPGEVHALVGENGAGKSTLINIIAGIHRRDSGKIVFDGKEVDFAHPLQAMEAGISVVHQELSLVPSTTVAENIFLRREKRNGVGLNDWRGMNRAATDVFRRISIDIDPNALAGSLSVGMQQLVEVAKAIALDAKLIIMEEPTSSLSEKDTAELFKVIRDLRQQGLGIIFVSHKLSELFTIADRITVLRDGRHIATEGVGSLTRESLIRMMVGRNLGNLYPPRAAAIGDVVFKCENLSCFGAVRDVNFEVRRREIVGLAGLVGSGRTEAMRALVNADKRASGSFWLDGQPVRIEDPEDALAYGIVYLSEDRKGSGLFLSYSIAENIGASTFDRYADRFGFLRPSALRTRAKEFIKRMDIRPPDESARVINLSGGNQQKVLISKALDVNPKVLIVDEPTRGVDVGAKALIHAQIRDLAQSGIGVIVVSSEMPEVVGLSDRILVFRNGAISAELDNQNGEVTQETIMTHAVYQ